VKKQLSVAEAQLRLAELINGAAQLLHAHRPGEATKLLEEAWEIAPGNPDVAINLSSAYVMQFRWAKAIRLLEKATRENPNVVMLWVNLAAAYLGPLESSEPAAQERAIVAYQEALRCDPVSPNVHYNLGLIYYKQGAHERAAAHFWRALEVDPNDEDARQWLKKLPGKPDDAAKDGE
jgi:tetratricopeptide (TPR) repeat protein